MKLSSTNTLLKRGLIVPSNLFESGMFAVHLKKLVTRLNAPIYLGMTTLDYSKVIMYDFHYNFMTGFPNKKFLFTDTDSLTYVIYTHNLYEDILSYINKWFDTSDYPKDHTC